MSNARWFSALAFVGFVGVAACAGNGGLSSAPGDSTGSTGARFVDPGVPSAFGGALRAAVRRPADGYPTNKTLLFESDLATGTVNVYSVANAKKNAAPIAALTVQSGCPYNNAIDAKGDIFVVDNCFGNDIEEFPPGQTSPSAIITDGLSSPLGIAIDKKGTLYVSNNPAAIQVYKAGASSPFETITSGSLSDPFGLALDKKGDLFIADFGARQVFEVLAGSTQVQQLGLQDLVEPLGVAVNLKTGELWVTDGEGQKVNVYPAGLTKPSRTLTGFGDPYAISIANQVPPGQRGTAAISDSDEKSISLYKSAGTSPYAVITNGVSEPTGVLLAKP